MFPALRLEFISLILYTIDFVKCFHFNELVTEKAKRLRIRYGAFIRRRVMEKGGKL